MHILCTILFVGTLELTVDRRWRFRMKRAQSGFSLIELLIVVAIILIIAAIAVPSFLSSKMAANEASAVQSIRTINTGQASYSVQFGQGFSTQLSNLGGSGTSASPTNALLIDNVVAGGTKDGYTFTYTVTANDPDGNPSGYSINGNPVNPGSTGRRSDLRDPRESVHRS